MDRLLGTPAKNQEGVVGSPVGLFTLALLKAQDEVAR
jgi:hypothetical protein